MQKVLAAAGVGSRRDCEELIREGRVEVDGEIVQELGTRVDPVSQRIRVDGTTLPAPRRVYYLLNKPSGVLCTNNDPSGRARAVDLIRSNERLFTVGRLDQASEGLIILTNDGELANQLTHPRYGIEKVYRVRVAGTPEPAVLDKLKRGVHFADGFAKVSDVRVKSRLKQSTDLEIVLNEGRNREIRRLLARIGHKVLSLTRIAMGPLRLGDVPSGAHRQLTREEVKSLRNAALAPAAEATRATNQRPNSGRGDPPRTSAKPKFKTSSKTSGSSAAAAARPKPKPRELSFSDQPMPGAILGGDEVPEVKKTIKPGTKKSSSRMPNSKKTGTNKLGSRKPSRGKPSKKGRR
ncbi:MAG: pseudouridine synthase [Planctomycetota bacterium]|nr:pseudouridine synthase [Planctomycetota bacterium]